MTKKRRTHSAQDKARIALEAISGVMTTSEIAAKYQVHPVQVSQWKKQLLEGAADVFDKAGGRKKEQDFEALEDRHHSKIGQLVLEVDWLKKKCRQLQIPIDGER